MSGLILRVVRRREPAQPVHGGPDPYRTIQRMFRSWMAILEPEREFELKLERWLSERKKK